MSVACASHSLSYFLCTFHSGVSPGYAVSLVAESTSGVLYSAERCDHVMYSVELCDRVLYSAERCDHVKYSAERCDHFLCVFLTSLLNLRCFCSSATTVPPELPEDLGKSAAMMLCEEISKVQLCVPYVTRSERQVCELVGVDCAGRLRRQCSPIDGATFHGSVP